MLAIDSQAKNMWESKKNTLGGTDLARYPPAMDWLG